MILKRTTNWACVCFAVLIFYALSYGPALRLWFFSGGGLETYSAITFFYAPIGIDRNYIPRVYKNYVLWWVPGIHRRYYSPKNNSN